MNDREMLKFAAKAARVGGGWEFIGGPKNSPCYRGADGRIWNPRDDDGDSFRLMVALRLPIRDGLNGTVQTGDERSGWPIWELWGDDPRAATRLAIFRAAVEIGRAME